jgi:hypothetical protein
MCEERVTEALKALRSADAGVETGPEAEIRALLAFRRQQRRYRGQRMAAVWGATGTIAAAAVLVASYWPARETPHRLVAIEAPAETEAVSVPALAPPPSPPVTHKVRRPAEPEEIVTGFFELMESPPPLERGLLVRMTVPASAMRAVGLPVGDDHLSDPVQADVLVGQDDLARAIRFVSYRKIRD